MPPALETVGLAAGYVAGSGRADVVAELDFQLGAGEAIALVGPNGAGKSTTLKALMGLIPMRARRLAIAGTPIEALPTYRRAGLGLGYVPEERRIFPELTVRENLLAGKKGKGPWDFERVLALFPALCELQDRRGEDISGGEQQMLTLARTLMGNPSVILLDEPTEGVAPLVVERLAHAIAALKAEGAALIVAEQNLDLVESVCDQVLVLQGGRIAYRGRLGESGVRSRCEALLWG